MDTPYAKLILPEATRRVLWARLVDGLERYAREVDDARVAPRLDPGRLRELLRPFDFAAPRDPLAALDFALAGLSEHQVHTAHPRYFGLFNPAPTTMGVVADAVVAAFNPQLAAWSHSPLAAEIERHLLIAFGERLGYAPDSTEGTFASGGAEANHTALCCALAAAFSAHGERGLRALAGDPVLYASAEGHHSVLKAARLCGLGTAAVREIEVDDELRLRPAALARRIAEDRAAGRLPFLVVATAGTTNAGTVDRLDEIADVAAGEGLWLHVDAAWGGAAALVPELRPVLAGIERADSITLDAHKWLSVPMAAGMLLVRHRGALERAFRVANAYMPKEAQELGLADPYASSMQWSRRFIGLKLFLSLAVAGWDGYAAALRHQTAMGDLLRARLTESGWRIVNRTPLPTVCFDDPALRAGDAAGGCAAVARRVVDSGKAWISTTRVGPGRAVLRACITNLRTGPGDVEALIEALDEARAAARAAGELS